MILYSIPSLEKVLKLCEFPVPSANLISHLWSELFSKLLSDEPLPPEETISPDCQISTIFELGNKIWVGFSFYEGEESNGVGGIGFFDKETKKCGILRHPALLDYGISEISVRNDKIFAKTEGHYECSSTYGNGLVTIDLKTLNAIAKVPSGTQVLFNKDDPISNGSYQRPILELLNDESLIEKEIPKWTTEEKEKILKMGLESFMLSTYENENPIQAGLKKKE